MSDAVNQGTLTEIAHAVWDRLNDAYEIPQGVGYDWDQADEDTRIGEVLVVGFVLDEVRQRGLSLT